MIIQALRAKNLLKYRRLELQNLPEKGLIAVSGNNEAGKTAIAEIICFALFGRTSRVDFDGAAKVIRWGETSGEVEITFTGKDGSTYFLNRQIDSEGRQGVRLTREEGGEPEAKGIKAVGEHVVGVCGFDYQEFVGSVYLSQQDPSLAQLHVDRARAICGVTAMEELAGLFQRQIAEERQHIAEMSDQRLEAEQQLAAMAWDEKLLPSQEGDRRSVQEKVRKTERDGKELEAGLAKFRDAAGETAEAAARMAEARPEWSFRDWQERLGGMEESVARLGGAVPRLEGTSDTEAVVGPLKAFAEDVRGGLTSFGALRVQGGAARNRLLALTGDQDGDTGGEDPLPKLIEERKTAARRSRACRGRYWAGSLLLALIAVSGWTAWTLLTQSPQGQTAQDLNAWIVSRIPQWDLVRHGFWLLLGSAALSLLVLWPLNRAFAASSAASRLEAECLELEARVERLRRQAETLQGLEDVALPAAVANMEQVDDRELAEAARGFRAETRLPLDGETAFAEFQAEVEQKADASASAVSALDAAVEERLRSFRQGLEELKRQLKNLDSQIEIEQKRHREANELNATIKDLAMKVTTGEHQIQVRTTARELLAGTCRQAMERFNRDLRVFMGRVLPLLTHDRYHYLQVDPEMQFRVFSGQKHDFIGWEEISTSTQQQILLAFRFALAATLAKSISGGRGQAVILDEPFAFYDKVRMMEAVEALPKMSEDLTQVWIITQEFESTEKFALHIACEVEKDAVVLPAEVSGV